ncbi:MAG: DUF3110 domain-containing protein [Pegethrix bostrychoides GSE-TBD4-15B]|uniref:DUF3110 domain-containing protein n=1 Tax=Pegethrix bostrychoides GSE-TBD4-15B TaxID=2839662 RepID=A0A951U6T4_9CYAN|nr:DUF3110 domain-containing protein [Pegethrix bostrychoides GSE-TBD4-15B]
MQVFVLLFNARTENEGIHTLKVEGRDLVLMFESEEDATRYALLLEAQDFTNPTVERFDQAEIEEFCESGSYECKLVPEGTLAIPPETNVEETDWSPEGQPKEQPQPDQSGEFSETELDQMRRKLEGLL